jgi:putative radical SAM enzyme (TIGR03279 family)
MLPIQSVAPGSIAAELELQPGDLLLAVNGQPLRDFLDYVRLTRHSEELTLDLRRSNGEEWEVELEKDAEEELGLEVEHPQPTQCGNNCLFCFVQQLPRGLRPTLYVKDEDYRFSYLYGAYVTLSTIREDEVERILTDHLSPLYVSVHASDEGLRARLLGRRSLPPLFPLLKRLIAGGIELHTQIVLCPGLNDGPSLEKSVVDLGHLLPGILSLALVPVGLTGHRAELPQLRTHNREEARALLVMVEKWQQDFLGRGKSRFVFAADEFYLKAGVDFPPLDDYENLPQYENGVGMIPLFRAEAAEVLAAARPLSPFVVDCLTGVSFYPEMKKFSAALGAATGVTIVVHLVENHFFAGDVTVTGLLTGADIVTALQGKVQSSILLIPDVVFRDGEDLFLDNMAPDELAAALEVEIFPIAASPWGIAQALEMIAAEFTEEQAGFHEK